MGTRRYWSYISRSCSGLVWVGRDTPFPPRSKVGRLKILSKKSQDQKRPSYRKSAPSDGIAKRPSMSRRLGFAVRTELSTGND